MNFLEFLFEKLNMVLVNLFAATALIVFLKLVGIQGGALGLILIVWGIILIAVWGREYWSQKRKYDEIESQLEELDKKYLICELLGEPESQMEKLYTNMLRAGSKSMVEEVNEKRNALSSYKEYIEEWIHEVKTPITAIDLVCKNHPTEETLRIQKELQEIERFVEQALYYARSEVVEKDYFIKEISLSEIVYPVILEYRTMLLEHRVQIVADDLELCVYTDEKWIQFILKQLLSNAVKYARKDNAKIHIYSQVVDGKKYLTVEDNGIGIAQSDIGRVCEKGFTGRNRAKKKSTGMGLYLAKRLCERLGIGLSVTSKEGVGTKVSLQFCK